MSIPSLQEKKIISNIYHHLRQKESVADTIVFIDGFKNSKNWTICLFTLVHKALFCKLHNRIIFLYKLSFSIIFPLKHLTLPPFLWNTAIFIDFFVSVPKKPILSKSYLPRYKKGQVKLCRPIYFQRSIHLWICCNFLFIWTFEKAWKWGVLKLLSEMEKQSKRLWKASLTFFVKLLIAIWKISVTHFAKKFGLLEHYFCYNYSYGYICITV